MSSSRNIVLVSFDSLRADHCGYMGYDRNTTPTLDEMAAEGITFERANSPASRTNPSMAGIFTGEPMVFRDEVSNPDISRGHLERHGTIAEDLQAAGYETGAYNPNAYASQYFGFDRGFDHYEDFLFEEDRYQSVFDKHLSDAGVYAKLRNLRNFVRREEVFRTWESYIDDLESWVGEEPFFLWVFSLETHFPCLTPRKHRRYSSIVDQYYYNWICNRLIDEFDVDVSDRTWEKIIDIYDDSIRFGDVLLAELRERLSEYDPLFVVIGDHGEAFGEHGTYGHFYPELYEENIHVPWVIWGEDVPFRTVSEPTSLLDLREMLQEYASTGELTILDHDRPPIASDYDGRWNRNLTSTWSEDVNFVRERTPDGIDDHVASTAGDDPDSQIVDALGAVVSRRIRHERELISIQKASKKVKEI